MSNQISGSSSDRPTPAFSLVPHIRAQRNNVSIFEVQFYAESTSETSDGRELVVPTLDGRVMTLLYDPRKAPTPGQAVQWFEPSEEGHLFRPGALNSFEFNQLRALISAQRQEYQERFRRRNYRNS